MEILLASQSPRRKELFTLIGLPFKVGNPSIMEMFRDGESSVQYVSRLSREKAAAFFGTTSPGTTIIAADTIVAFGETILEKPRSEHEARSILLRLRGATHRVYTAITVARCDAIPVTSVITSEVPMRCYSDQEIDDYIATGDPFDKAGAYAIQHSGFHPVDRFAGCFANVMGLPLCDLTVLMKASGLVAAPGIEWRCQNHLGYACPVFEDILYGGSIHK